MKKGLLVVISGPSGTGKGTVCGKLLEVAEHLAYSVSATTRAPRPGEVDGKNYYFLSREEFELRISKGGFLEWAEVYGNYYGTPLKQLEERMDEGEDILLEIDTQGALNVMEKRPDGVFIFLLPPSMKELEKRICGRGTETENSLCCRIGAAAKEIEVGRKYQYVVINDTVEEAVERIRTILSAERFRVERNGYLFEELCR